MSSRLISRIETISSLLALFGAIVIQRRIFYTIARGYNGETIFISVLGSNGIYAPRTLALAWFGCVGIFLLSLTAILVDTLRKR